MNGSGGGRDGGPVLWIVSAAVLLITAAFTLYGLALQRTIDDVADNARRIEGNAWLLCNDLNAGFSRQNAVIDQAIGDAQRSPAPDKERIDQLRNFKIPLRNCGSKPESLR